MAIGNLYAKHDLSVHTSHPAPPKRVARLSKRWLRDSMLRKDANGAAEASKEDVYALAKKISSLC